MERDDGLISAVDAAYIIPASILYEIACAEGVNCHNSGMGRTAFLKL